MLRPSRQFVQKPFRGHYRRYTWDTHYDTKITQSAGKMQVIYLKKTVSLRNARKFSQKRPQTSVVVAVIFVRLRMLAGDGSRRGERAPSTHQLVTGQRVRPDFATYRRYPIRQ
jgi:hypothetical protein